MDRNSKLDAPMMPPAMLCGRTIAADQSTTSCKCGVNGRGTCGGRCQTATSSFVDQLPAAPGNTGIKRKA